MTPLGKANLLTLTVAPLAFVVVLFLAGTIGGATAMLLGLVLGNVIGGLLYAAALAVAFGLAALAFVATVRAIRRRVLG